VLCAGIGLWCVLSTFEMAELTHTALFLQV
jgi:hypothetical protein